MDLEALFPCLRDRNFIQNLGQIPAHSLKRVEKLPRHYRLECTGGNVLECEHLYWGRGPWQLLHLYHRPGQALTGLCHKSPPLGALFVRYEFAAPIAVREETLFFPLSYTHPWGHFVGEFGRDGALELVGPFDRENVSEEEIGRRIKMLGRHLEKIFPNFKREYLRRFIRLEDFCPGPGS